MCNRGRSRGFISLRGLLALFVVLLILPVSTSALVMASKLSFDHDDVSNEIALLQLRRIMLIAYDVNNYGNSLEFIYHGDNYRLEENNNRLVLSPGYQMFLNNIDNVYFYEESGAIFIEYEYKGKIYKTPIVKEYGIYLDEFSSDSVVSDSD